MVIQLEGDFNFSKNSKFIEDRLHEMCGPRFDHKKLDSLSIKLKKIALFQGFKTKKQEKISCPLFEN
jgi:hypothetical protein